MRDLESGSPGSLKLDEMRGSSILASANIHMGYRGTSLDDLTSFLFSLSVVKKVLLPAKRVYEALALDRAQLSKKSESVTLARRFEGNIMIKKQHGLKNSYKSMEKGAKEQGVSWGDALLIGTTSHQRVKIVSALCAHTQSSQGPALRQRIVNLFCKGLTEFAPSVSSRIIKWNSVLDNFQPPPLSGPLLQSRNSNVPDAPDTPMQKMPRSRPPASDSDSAEPSCN